MTIQTKSIDILLVEDNEGDVILTQEALSSSKIANSMQVVRDGEEALRYLKKEAEYQNATKPDLILLDLNIPKKDGNQVLAEIKSIEGLMDIPVVVLTSSQADKDIIKSYGYNANSYLVKPVNFEKLLDIVNEIEGFWLSIVIKSPNSDELNIAS